MVRKLLIVAVCLLSAGCADAPPPALLDVSQLPAGALGSDPDADQAALNLAQAAFADPDTTYGHPAQAARAVAAMDYIAGEWSYNPRWAFVSADTKQLLLQGREQVRQTVGVAPGATSQMVVDHLIAAANALTAGDQATAIQQLGPPVFNAPGAEVLARLSKLPNLQTASTATTQATDELFPGNSNGQPAVPIP